MPEMSRTLTATKRNTAKNIDKDSDSRRGAKRNNISNLILEASDERPICSLQIWYIVRSIHLWELARTKLPAEKRATIFSLNGSAFQMEHYIGYAYNKPVERLWLAYASQKLV